MYDDTEHAQERIQIMNNTLIKCLKNQTNQNFQEHQLDIEIKNYEWNQPFTSPCYINKILADEIFQSLLELISGLAYFVS